MQENFLRSSVGQIQQDGFLEVSADKNKAVVDSLRKENALKMKQELHAQINLR